MRKSFGSGLFRINLSRSGISYSFGVKGARINVSQRGTYVSFGSNGIYYRRKISGNNTQQNSGASLPPVHVPTSTQPHTITSTDFENITDTDSQDFINELTEKSGKISYYKWLGVLPVIFTATLFLYVFFSTETSQPVTINETKDFINTATTADAKIRSAPDKKAIVLGVLTVGDQQELLSDSNKDWYKIRYNGQDGYVVKKLTEKKAITTTHETSPLPGKSLYDAHASTFWLCMILFIPACTFWLRYLKRVDRERLLVEIYYDIDERVNEVYQKFVHHFSSLLQCRKTWQYLHTQRTYDYKYTSGAGQLVTRKPLSKISVNKKPSEIFETNVQVPYLGLINTELYFFPERLVIKRGNQYGAIMYKNVDCDQMITRFIETGGVPGDSVVVDHTWRFLNKNGTPDRRFNNNYKIPICEYSEYHFTSSSGLNEKIVTSKVNAFHEFIRYIKAIGLLQEHIATHSS